MNVLGGSLAVALAVDRATSPPGDSPLSSVPKRWPRSASMSNMATTVARILSSKVVAPTTAAAIAPVVGRHLPVEERGEELVAVVEVGVPERLADAGRGDPLHRHRLEAALDDERAATSRRCSRRCARGHPGRLAPRSQERYGEVSETRVRL